MHILVYVCKVLILTRKAKTCIDNHCWPGYWTLRPIFLALSVGNETTSEWVCVCVCVCVCFSQKKLRFCGKKTLQSCTYDDFKCMYDYLKCMYDCFDGKASAGILRRTFCTSKVPLVECRTPRGTQVHVWLFRVNVWWFQVWRCLSKTKTICRCRPVDVKACTYAWMYVYMCACSHMRQSYSI